MEIVQDLENKLLGRRELVLKFRAGNGLLSRQSAADAISSRFEVAKDNVMVISLWGSSGTRDCYAKTYLFSSKEDVKTQLPDYISLRHLSKEERKKAREEKRKKGVAKAPSEQQTKVPEEKKE